MNLILFVLETTPIHLLEILFAGGGLELFFAERSGGVATRMSCMACVISVIRTIQDEAGKRRHPTVYCEHSPVTKVD